MCSLGHLIDIIKPVAVPDQRPVSGNLENGENLPPIRFIAADIEIVAEFL
jgi:hypothetical protein